MLSWLFHIPNPKLSPVLPGSRESFFFCLLQREKVADVSAKQIYDRLRSSRMTDEVLLTVFVNYN